MISDIEKHAYAILDQVHKRDELDQVIYDLDSMAEYFSYKVVAENFTNEEQKRAVIEKKVATIQSDILRPYFEQQILANNLQIFDPGKFKILCKEFKSNAEKIIFMQLTSPVSIESTDLHELSEKLSRRMQHWVKIDVSVDPSIIGGAIIKNDNYIIDYSLKTRLNNFAAEWKKSLYNTEEANG